MMVVLNWLHLQLSDEDLKRVAEGLERPTKLRLVLQKLMKALLSQHPWTTRTDTVHLFHPSHRYEVNQLVAMPKFPEGTWCIAQVIEVKEDQNPKQGKFQIVRLRANGEEKAYAANIPDAQPLPFTIDPKRLQGLADYFSEPLSNNITHQLRKIANERRSLKNLLPAQADELLQQCVAEQGQYVTHRLVADFMVNLAQPKPDESIADICCGSGIFLVKAFRFVKKSTEMMQWLICSALMFVLSLVMLQGSILKPTAFPIAMPFAKWIA